MFHHFEFFLKYTDPSTFGPILLKLLKNKDSTNRYFWILIITLEQLLLTHAFLGPIRAGNYPCGGFAAAFHASRFLGGGDHKTVGYTALRQGGPLLSAWSRFVYPLGKLAADSGYAPSTVVLFRWAVLVFHVDPDSITHSRELLSCLTRIKRAAPPISLSRPTVDLTESFNYLHSIPSQSSTTLHLLSQKCAFLLAASAFLRPPDLYRISLVDSRVEQNCLALKIIAPKETRNNRRIVKEIKINALPEDTPLCPVVAFQALVDHPGRESTAFLFVNSRVPSNPLTVTTLSTCVWFMRPILWGHKSVFLSLGLAQAVPLKSALVSSGSGSPLDSHNCLEDWTNLN
ncbi:hypothetical protein BDA99DRAFT_532721 [Phascolomyces articulosus]|uniref:Uncharacterized protein n=1 Tax=Phascolomyces articulosus TaxID=60185 RepID=A0AAD5PI99_9FUNG|nr:hypothetical protein BDA99DRAFT_532721 [Phascolomyces articulosus]